MASRHEHRAGDWHSLARRMYEIISAHSGEDPLVEALKLVVAKLEQETEAAGRFLPEPRAHLTGVDPVQVIDSHLERAARRWPGIVEPDCRTHLTAVALRRCAELLRHQDLRAGGLAALDAIFEVITSRAAKEQKGQFFTPRFVVAEIARWMNLQAGESVVDPACGSGAFLWHAVQQEPLTQVWGFDLDPRAVQLAKVVVACMGRDVGSITQSDSLAPESAAVKAARSHRLAGSGFDVVMTNPPFAGDVGDAYAAHYELAAYRRVERDVLFLERIVALLRPGGRYAVVLPHNKVGSQSWAFVRRWLLTRSRVVAVVGLGRDTFSPHTSQKACVVVGVKRTTPVDLAKCREPIAFYLSERTGKDRQGRHLYAADGSIDHDLGDVSPTIRHALEAAGG